MFDADCHRFPLRNLFVFLFDFWLNGLGELFFLLPEIKIHFGSTDYDDNANNNVDIIHQYCQLMVKIPVLNTKPSLQRILAFEDIIRFVFDLALIDDCRMSLIATTFPFAIVLFSLLFIS